MQSFSSLLITIFSCFLLLQNQAQGRRSLTPLELGFPKQLTERWSAVDVYLRNILKPGGCPEPKPHCKGLDCQFVTERRTCQICTCPIGSPARGCDKMPEKMRTELFDKGCPLLDESGNLTRTKVVLAKRWYREIGNGLVDECRSYDFPLCANIDYNLWRSPVSLKECLFYCYPGNKTSVKDRLKDYEAVTKASSFKALLEQGSSEDQINPDSDQESNPDPEQNPQPEQELDYDLRGPQNEVQNPHWSLPDREPSDADVISYYYADADKLDKSKLFDKIPDGQETVIYEYVEYPASERVKDK